MTKFLNSSSKKFKAFKQEAIDYCETLFDSFLVACEQLDEKAFFGKHTNRFNISTFEAVFAATCQHHFLDQTLVSDKIPAEKLEELSADTEFIESTQKNTASSENVALRRKKAAQVLFGL